jgi:CheY-like chemotaxis protein
MDENKFGSGQKIVIVEDNASLADIYKTRLELLGYQCFVATEGIEALSVIEKERPDLVLLDLMMPKLAGHQVLQIMRSTDWGRDTKVYVISNLNESEADPSLRQNGIEGYAVKANLTNDQLDQLVDSILKPTAQTEAITLE